MLTRYQVDRQFAAQALKAEALTPQHSAAEAAVSAEGDEGAKRSLRERIQHEADPYLHEDDLPEVAQADLPKAFDQAVNVPEGYPPMRPVRAEDFRRGPLTGHAAYGAGYEPGRPVSIPAEALSPGTATSPALFSKPDIPGRA